MKNIGARMKQVQEMQTRMADMQARLETLTVSGQSGAGLVKVSLSGKGVMMGLEVDPSLLKPEEKEMLEDLVIAAHRDAKSRMDAMVAEEMKQVTGGLPLPPGFQLPF